MLFQRLPRALCLNCKFVYMMLFERPPCTLGTQGSDNTSDTQILVGLSGLEPPTSRLSGVRSNRLSYRPMQGKWVLSSYLLFAVSHFLALLTFSECSIHIVLYIQKWTKYFDYSTFVYFVVLNVQHYRIVHSKINSTQS